MNYASRAVLVISFLSLSVIAEPQEKEGRNSCLGIYGSNVTLEVKEHLGLPEQSGAWVMLLYPNGPAYKAGIQMDDVILKVEGSKINSLDHLLIEIREYPPASKVSLEIFREGKIISTAVELGDKRDYPDKPEYRDPIKALREEEIFRYLKEEPHWGLWVEGVVATPEVEKQDGAKEGTSALYVVGDAGWYEYEPVNHPANIAGIQRGDLIIAVNRLTSGHQMAAVLLDILRRGEGSVTIRFLRDKIVRVTTMTLK